MKVTHFLSLWYSCLALLLSSCTQPATPEAERAVISQLDAAQYMGTWYEIARLENRFEKGLEQVTASYALESDGTVKVINRGYNTQTGRWREATGKALFVDPPQANGQHSGRLKVSFFGPFYSDYHILELDQPYYNYALVSSGRDYLWILSRSPQLAYPIKQHLMAKATALGFNTSLLHFTRQVNPLDSPAGQHVLPTTPAH